MDYPLNNSVMGQGQYKTPLYNAVYWTHGSSCLDLVLCLHSLFCMYPHAPSLLLVFYCAAPSSFNMKALL